LAFTGSPISASEAYRIGLVDQVTTLEELLPAARALATVIAAKSPLGLRYGKKALNQIEDMPFEEGFAVEQDYTAKLLETEDAHEARKALVEKRAPVFTGK
jgi:enoyl-CoA hydratase